MQCLILLYFQKSYERDKLFEAFPRVTWAPLFSHRFCRKGSPFQDLCYDIIFSITGINSKLYLRVKFLTNFASSPKLERI